MSNDCGPRPPGKTCCTSLSEKIVLGFQIFFLKNPKLFRHRIPENVFVVNELHSGFFFSHFAFVFIGKKTRQFISINIKGILLLPKATACIRGLKTICFTELIQRLTPSYLERNLQYIYIFRHKGQFLGVWPVERTLLSMNPSRAIIFQICEMLCIADTLPRPELLFIRAYNTQYKFVFRI